MVIARMYQVQEVLQEVHQVLPQVRVEEEQQEEIKKKIKKNKKKCILGIYIHIYYMSLEMETLFFEIFEKYEE